MALVKLFLAIPHLIILGILRGGESGLTTLLVFIAGIILLFTGKYPKGIFDLVMGVHAWWYRTIAYVAFMTDSYPPFRLDVPPPLAHRLPLARACERDANSIAGVPIALVGPRGEEKVVNVHGR